MQTRTRSPWYGILLTTVLLTAVFLLLGNTTVHAEATEEPDLPALTIEEEETLAFVEENAVIKVGQTSRLLLAAAPADEAVRFSVNDEKLCAVDDDGNVTGLKTGVVTVSAVTDSGKIATIPVEVTAPVSEIRLDRSAVTLRPGSSYQLVSRVLPENAPEKTIEWSSNAPEIAAVEDGCITALQKGMALVTAEGADGVRAYCIVQVGTMAQSVFFEEESVSLSVGDSKKLQPVLLPEDADLDSLYWETDDPAVATINEDGVVTAAGTGTATVTVWTENRLSAAVTVKVFPAVESVVLSDHVLSLGVGEIYALRTAVSPADAYNKTLRWKSSAPAVVLVKEGILTARKPGTATITVTSASGKTATCVVTVKNAPESFSTSPSQFSLGVGESYQLRLVLPENTAAAGASFTSNDSEVCRVSTDGTLTAIKTGYAEITAELFNGVKATAMVWVMDAPTSITATQTEYSMAVGSTKKLLTRVDGASFTRTYTSANENIVAVTASGNMIAKSVGTTTVTASTYNNQSVTVTVTVRPLPSSVSISDHVLVLGVGQEYTLRTLISPANALNASLSWTSSNTGAVTVQNGVLTAKAVGSAVITATTANGKTANCQVTVKKAPDSVTLSPQSLTLGAGESYRLRATLPADTAAAAMSFISGDPNICTVGANGIVSALKAGTTTVTVRLYNGKQASTLVQVVPAPTKVTLDRNQITLGAGEKTALTAKSDIRKSSETLTFASSNEGVLSVSASGEITAKAEGTASVTVSAYNGVSAVCRITVKPAPSSVSVSPAAVSLPVGATSRLTPKIGDTASCSSFTYESDDPDICTVSASGVITAKKVGRTTVTVTTYNGKEASCEVVVRKAADSLHLYVKKRTLKPGKTLKLLYYFTPSGVQETVSFTSGNTKVCTVDKTGTVTAIAEGTAVITAVSQSGKVSTCTITVTSNSTLLAKDVANVGPLYEHFTAVGQYPELPTGCEITALTAVLNFLGYNVDKCTLSDNYLEKGPAWSTDFHEAFAGEPRSSYSYGCYAPAIVKAANKYLTEKKSSYRARELDHFNFDDLFHFTENGIPVLVWTTIDLREGYYTASWEANGKTVTWYANEHCMVLLGQSGSRVYTADPTTGKIVSYDKDLFRTRYQELFSQSVVIQ